MRRSKAQKRVLAKFKETLSGVGLPNVLRGVLGAITNYMVYGQNSYGSFGP